MRLPPLLAVGALALVAGLAACDARPSPAAYTLGFASPPEWPREDCAPDVETTLFTVPASRYWHCRLPRYRATVTVDWWRGTAIAGERRWSGLDSARWESFQDSLARALAPRAAARACTLVRPPEVYPPGFVPRQRLWSVGVEGRWVAMQAMYSSWERLGYVIVRTAPGDVDACADSLRRQVIMGQIGA